jgi:ABC transport system ATP-binding/permease protein
MSTCPRCNGNPNGEDCPECGAVWSRDDSTEVEEDLEQLDFEPRDLTEEDVSSLLVANRATLSGVVLDKIEDYTTEDSGTFEASPVTEVDSDIMETIFDVRVHLNQDFSAQLAKAASDSSARDGDRQMPEVFEPILIGRDPECTLVLSGPLISSKHARLLRTDKGLELEDLDSANGTFVDEQPIKRVMIGWDQPFIIGDRPLVPRDVIRKVMEKHAEEHTFAGTLGLGQISGGFEEEDSTARMEKVKVKTATVDFGDGDALIVGRGADADIILDTPNVSRNHARLERAGDILRVTDLGSTNGTFVNGRRISGVTTVQPDDDLRIGPHRLELTSDFRVRRHHNARSGITGVRVEAWKLCRDVGIGKSKTRIVDEVSFSVLPGEMVAVMGPSGAGKTSVLTTLAGYTRPSTGEVDLDGLNLYHHYDVFRSAIGYVPQEDVMHRSLTVEEVLYYQARLIFPAENSDEEIYERIGTILKQLDLTSVRHSIVGDAVRRGLSGGQRKRLNVAMELLSEPSLLLLDEPTSGLDSRSANSLIREFRSLAEAGRTILMTIHQPRLESYQLFDKLLLLTKGGKLAYFGPIEGARSYFEIRSNVEAAEVANPADYVLEALDPANPELAQPPEYWQNSYRKSREYERFVGRRLKAGALRQVEPPEWGERQRKAAFLRQTRILMSRAFRLVVRDRSAVLVQILQAPIIAALAVLLFRDGRYWPMRLEDDVTPTLFVIVAAAVWFGCSNVAREIVGERSIYRRERMRRLRPGAYLLSKLIMNGSVIAVQLGILISILIPVVGLEGDLLGLFGVPLIAGWAAMCIGLLVSAASNSEVTAIQVVPLVVLPQVMLSGILVAVGGPSASSMAGVLSQPVLLRWAYGAYLQVEFAVGTPRGDKSHNLVTGGRYWEQVGFGEDVLLFDLGMMGLIGLSCALITWIILVRRNRR